MQVNQLQLNPNKTVHLDPSSRGHYKNFSDLCIGGINEHPSTSAKSVGIYFYQSLSFEFQLSTVSKSCYFQLRQLRPICRRLDQETVQTLLQLYVSSHLDYSNVLYWRLPAHRLKLLQPVQNNAARLCSGTWRTEHITPVLREDLVYTQIKKVMYSYFRFAKPQNYTPSLIFFCPEFEGHGPRDPWIRAW